MAWCQEAAGNVSNCVVEGQGSQVDVIIGRDTRVENRDETTETIRSHTVNVVPLDENNRTAYRTEHRA